VYNESMSMDGKKVPASIAVLRALIPYTEQNLKLVFHPGRFFDELEQSSGYSKLTLQQSYYRLKNHGFVSDDKVPNLTAKGRRHVRPFVAKNLDGNARLMVIFDIPQDFSHQRRQLRNMLRQLGFSQTQKSVWISDKDYTEILQEAVGELKLGDWVELYEASKIK